MSEKYEPPSASIAVLDNVPSLIPRGKVITQALGGKKFLCKLPGGQLYFDSALQLDSDGAAISAQDPTGQAVTSTRYADGRSMDSATENYFVLPGGFYTPHGIKKGDIGVVFYQQRKVFACFGDVGPAAKLGEGSIALHRALGHETVVGGRLRNVGIAGDVITMVFPGSGNGKARTNAESVQIGEPLFKKLLLEADAYQFSELSRLKTREILITSNSLELEFQLFEWMQEVVRNTPHPDGSESWSAAYLVKTATGLELVMQAPPSMSLPPAGNQKTQRGHPKSVHADFKIERRPDGRWFVSHVHFRVNMTAAEHSTATRRVLEQRVR